MELVVRPIGFVRSPFGEKADAPRQGVVADAVGARVEVLAEHEDALSDLDGFDRIWIVFWFDRVERGERGERGARATPSKVLPPRSDVKRGVFATRSPHRPNPIGITAARLERVDGRVVFVRGVDLLDGTPVLDLKPYVPYADAFPDARAGWLEAPSGSAAQDPRPRWDVRFAPRAEEQLAWIAARAGDDALGRRIAETLALGPQPHAYRRIKRADDGSFVLAVKAWRVRFAVDAHARVLTIAGITTGYRAHDLAGDALHRAYVGAFGMG